MAFERKLATVPPQAFTSNGNAFGVITLADTAGFKVKQHAYLKNTAGATLLVQVKRVLSPTKLVVGLDDNKLSSWTPLDITSWTVASGASIGAEEQDKNNIPPDDHYKAIYEADPTVADRVVFVDQYGNFYDDTNPLPIAFDGTISIGNVRITACDNDPLPGDKHSSIRISDCVNDLAINTDGSINVKISETPITGNTVKSIYNEVASVATAVQTLITTYTVPALSTAVLQRINASGENVARYDVFLNGSPIDTQRTYFGGDFNSLFEYTTGTSNGLVLNAGDVVAVKVLHNRPFVGNFNARIQVLEIS